MNFRQIYNEKLERAMEIEKSININPKRFDELYPTFNKITLELSEMFKKCEEKYKYKMSDEEILKGFKEVD